MSRDNVLQITVTDSVRAFVEAQAKAEDSSVSGWLRRRLFFDPTEIMVRAIPCVSLEEAYELVGKLDDSFEKWPWPLLFRRIAESTSSSIFEVTHSDFTPWPGGVPDHGATLTRFTGITPEMRFILAGSPWPYKVVENFSSRAPGMPWRTVLRVENEREHNLWSRRPPRKPLDASPEA